MAPKAAVRMGRGEVPQASGKQISVEGLLFGVHKNRVSTELAGRVRTQARLPAPVLERHDMGGLAATPLKAHQEPRKLLGLFSFWGPLTAVGQARWQG